MSHAELAAILSACFCALMTICAIALMLNELGKVVTQRINAEHEAKCLAIELRDLRSAHLKLRANNSRWRLLEAAHREVRAERDVAREELREFKARLRRRTQRPAIFKQDFERRAWSWIVNNWHSLEPDQRAYQRDNAMKALKHDHEQVMRRLRERARLP